MKFRARGIVPGLTVVLVGDDPASAVYVGSKERTCIELGMHGETIRRPADITQEGLLAIIDQLNASSNVHGILVQMPLPKHIDSDEVVRRIRPDKDVDGFHPVNVGKLWIGERDGFAPCTPAGVLYMLQAHNVQTSGAQCVIVGRSNIVASRWRRSWFSPESIPPSPSVTAARVTWPSRPAVRIF